MRTEQEYQFVYEIIASGNIVGEIEGRATLEIDCDVDEFWVEDVRDIEFWHPIEDYVAPQDGDKAAKALAHEITLHLLSKEGQKTVENDLSHRVPEWVAEQRVADAEARADFFRGH